MLGTVAIITAILLAAGVILILGYLWISTLKEKAPLEVLNTNAVLEKKFITNAEIVYESEVLSKDILCFIIRDVLRKKHGDIQTVKMSIENRYLRFFVVNPPQKRDINQDFITSIENNTKHEVININDNNEKIGNERFSIFVILVLTDNSLNILSHYLILIKRFDESLIRSDKEVTEIVFKPDEIQNH